MRVAWPAGPAVKLTPRGRRPDSLTVGDGVPVAVTAKLKPCPAGVVSELGLVITGAVGGGVTVRLAAFVVAGIPTPFVNTARYWLPLIPVVTELSVSVVFVGRRRRR